jgi:hypothetical protein
MILQTTLPVRSELSKRGHPCSILCPRCNSKLETTTHTFMTCPNSLKVWFGSSLNINFQDQINPNFENWLYDILTHKDDNLIIQVAAITYSIWFARNLSVFEERIVPEDEIIT